MNLFLIKIFRPTKYKKSLINACLINMVIKHLVKISPPPNASLDEFLKYTHERSEMVRQYKPLIKKIVNKYWNFFTHLSFEDMQLIQIENISDDFIEFKFTTKL